MYVFYTMNTYGHGSELKCGCNVKFGLICRYDIVYIEFGSFNICL